VGAPNTIAVIGGNLITVLGDAFQVQNGATNITVSNGATVTGNSALLRVLDPPAETLVNFTASHASLFGDVFADPASQTTINLIDSTVLTGRVNPPPLGLGVNMTMDGSSEWHEVKAHLGFIFRPVSVWCGMHFFARLGK
jgi:hypothetical protein